MNRADAIAFSKSLAHRELAEKAALVAVLGGVTELRYKYDLEWPWPRAFSYRHEFIALTSAQEVLEVLDTVNARGNEHVIDLFHSDLEAELSVLREAGYIHAWTSPIFGRVLLHPWPRSVPLLFRPREVVSSVDLQRFNSLPGISNQPDAIDDRIHNFYVELQDEVVAKGQLVYLGEGIGYISDMYTAPAHRRQGLCNAMMAALEEKARALGAIRSVLAPGLEPLEMKLYDRYGYAPTAERAVLIPFKSRGSAA